LIDAESGKAQREKGDALDIVVPEGVDELELQDGVRTVLLPRLNADFLLGGSEAPPDTDTNGRTRGRTLKASSASSIRGRTSFEFVFTGPSVLGREETNDAAVASET
jgi:hypothetical protein